MFLTTINFIQTKGLNKMGKYLMLEYILIIHLANQKSLKFYCTVKFWHKVIHSQQPSAL